MTRGNRGRRGLRCNASRVAAYDISVVNKASTHMDGHVVNGEAQSVVEPVIR